MDKTTIIISLTFLTCIVLYLVFVLVFTNSYGNNKAKISNIDNINQLYKDNITKCVGKSYPYKKIDVFDTSLDQPIKECEYIAYGENSKFYLQSDGLYGMDEGLFGKPLTSDADYPAKIIKSGKFFNIVDNKGRVLNILNPQVNSGKYVLGNDGMFRPVK